MRRAGKALLGVLLLTLLVQGAAPPASTRALTAEEAKQVAALGERLQKHVAAGEFEQAVEVAKQMAEYRAERQGKQHWQAVDARYAVEEWRRLVRVVVRDRAEVVQARRFNEEGVGLLNQLRSREAEKPLREALAIREKVLGMEHPSTANSYNNVAGCLQAMGKAAEALPLYRQALAIREKVLGMEHPDTATSYNNVASCLQAMGKAAEALPLCRQALSIREKVLGKEHPSTANSYNNVASCLEAIGKAREALPLYRQALSIEEKVLGKEHSATALSGPFHN